MIDVKELRIGNTVGMDDAYWTIHALSSTAIEIKAPDGIITVYPDDIDPIPLTGELLEKCGFEQVIGDDPTESTYFDSARWCIFPTDAGYDFDGLVIIKHLHELQNLMQSLGQELNVNL